MAFSLITIEDAAWSLDSYSLLGDGLAAPGDVDGDGVPDLIVSTPGVDLVTGQVHMVLLNSDGSANTSTLIGDGPGIFSFYGKDVCVVKDMDGDNIPEVAIGAPGVDGSIPGSQSSGAMFITGSRGNVSIVSNQSTAHMKVELGKHGEFGSGLACCLNGTEYNESNSIGLFVAEPGKMRVHLLWIAPTFPLTLRRHVILYAPVNVTNSPSSYLGKGLALFVDDGTHELWVGAPYTNTVSPGQICVYTLRNTGNVSDIFSLKHCFTAPSPHSTMNDQFGSAIEAVDDWDGDGVRDVLIGAPSAKKVFLLYRGTWTWAGLLTPAQFDGVSSNDLFGKSLVAIGNVDPHDQVQDIAIGVHRDTVDGVEDAVMVARMRPATP